jgi:oligopeptide transport system substrate-binding protein
MRHLLVLLLAVAAICGCGRRETRVAHGDRERILHLNNGTEPQNLDPHVVTGVPEHHIIMALLEGLTSEDPHGVTPQPGTAERWDVSPDQTVYTFHLRHNVRWSNGDPLTAHDFVRSYRRALAPSLASEYAYMLYVMKGAEEFNTGKLTDFNQVGVQALDDFTLQVTLNAPTPYFLSLLLHYSWFPLHIPTIAQCGPLYERGNQWTKPKTFVGNGPFALEEWKVNHVIVVRKNSNYWNAAHVKLEKIYFYCIESSDTDERAFRSGQLHKMYEMPAMKIETYRQRDQQTHLNLLRIDPFLGTYFYVVNTTNGPLRDKRVRRALALSIDREAIVKNVTRGGQLPAYNFTPPGTAGYTARARFPFDIAGARKLLAEAGLPGGQGCPPIEILFNTLESHRAIAETIQEMWKKNLGIDARLLNQEWKVYLDSMKKTGNYQVARFGWIGDYPDPNSFLDLWVTGGGNNDARWSNPEYDRLIREASRTADLQKRLEVFQQAEAILMEEMPVIPIYFYTRVYAIQPSVQGWYPTILDNHPYQHVWLDPGREPRD